MEKSQNIGTKSAFTPFYYYFFSLNPLSSLTPHFSCLCPSCFSLLSSLFSFFHGEIQQPIRWWNSFMAFNYLFQPHWARPFNQQPLQHSPKWFQRLFFFGVAVFFFFFGGCWGVYGGWVLILGRWVRSGGWLGLDERHRLDVFSGLLFWAFGSEEIRPTVSFSVVFWIFVWRGWSFFCWIVSGLLSWVCLMWTYVLLAVGFFFFFSLL